MNGLKILYHLIIVGILIFLALVLYTTIYTAEGDNRVVYIYESLKDSEIEYYTN